MLYNFVIVMPFILLSGLMTPISTMPPFFQTLTLANPLRYAIHFVQRIYLENASLDLLISDLWPLLLMSILTLSLASWMFRHRFT
jgi:ABC-2 type transport system permease protein